MSRSPFAAVVLVLPLIVACRSDEDAARSAAAQATAAAQGLTLRALRNATYRGIGELARPVRLEDGHWEGEPWVAGGAARPAVSFVRDFRVMGDLDGDAKHEAVVLLAYSSGGSGSLVYLAVVDRRRGRIDNVATTRLGDRVQVRAVTIEGGRLRVEVVRPGAGDPACCPGELATLGFVLEAGELVPVETAAEPRALTLDALAGTVWVLRYWSWEEPAPPEPKVTLRYEAGRFAGDSGCNRYFAAATEGGEMPGEVDVGPVGATKRACPEPFMEVEDRFLTQLAAVRKYGFLAGQLALTYDDEGGVGVMLFAGSGP